MKNLAFRILDFISDWAFPAIIVSFVLLLIALVWLGAVENTAYREACQKKGGTAIIQGNNRFCLAENPAFINIPQE